MFRVNRLSAALMASLIGAAVVQAPQANAGWSRVPGGLRLDGEINAVDFGAFLHHFEAAMLEEPRYAPIAIWLAGSGGDEAAARRIAGILAVAQDQGVRLATVMAQGHACDGACSILFAVGDEQIASASGTRLISGN
ncbi:MULTISPECIES: hypothetical protein [unclassified Epibacterium]|jgi:hypothetical protein|uniref:hypothetical protein n=1 Tax=unclassified Epibacterium TaxID=2639179 RepID=UPI001EF707DF|nr:MULTISPECIES: hypothetical protein [unclassified Epibacterium]MCG7623408.1 hypothetical protein [Epibacterium sp. Ofav1-8]MCG7626271.1 hypothetical protein [Epibacterium sp. MM17-32]